MHELGMAKEILNIVTQTLRSHPGKQLIAVNVRIGEMNAVVPELLQSAYQGLVRNTPYQNSRIVLQLIPVEGYCQDCGCDFSPQSFVYACPHCSSTRFIINQGNELYIQDIEVE